MYIYIHYIYIIYIYILVVISDPRHTESHRGKMSIIYMQS